MGKIRLLHVVPSLNKGGQEKQLFELVRRLDKRRYDIMVVSLSDGCFWTKEISRYARCVEIERKGRVELKRLVRLVRLMREFGPDIVQCWSYSAIAYGISGALASSVPIKIITVRGKERCKNAAIYLANNAFYRLSDLVIYNSTEALNYERTLYRLPERKSKVILNGVDTGEFSPVRPEDRSSVLGIRIPENYKVIGTAASLTKRKNLTMFFDCAHEMLKIDAGFVFVLAGEGELEKELKGYARSLGIDGSVHFAGRRNDIPSLLGCFDAFWLTSKEEGTPNSILEAMAAGVPVVATDVGGNREIIEHPINGYLVTLNDVKRMAGLTMKVLGNRPERERVVENALETVRMKFDMRRMVEDYDNAYRAFYEVNACGSR
ncbi:MAG: glycosyltransferase [Deltaproteobacteria bacterium]|nr:glycosyltransferase [Deltaproteobacteria bacterium]